jgi:lysophospholipid acyltransferase (LPLAT)-like uncharacterized protein
MAGVEKELEKRGGLKERLVGFLAGWLIRIYGWTLRREVIDHAGVLEGKFTKGALVPLWHNRLFVIGPIWKICQGDSETAVLTSASSDGAIVEAGMRVFGYEAVRGSSSRRGRAAIVGVMRKVKQGCFVGITPDGPRGPRYVLQPGLVKLAQACRVPVIPLRIEYKSAWRMNTWDQFGIPKPFSKVIVTIEVALDVPRELDEDAFEAQRLRIQEIMREGIDDFIPEDNDQN